MTELVSITWLEANLKNKDLILLDASVETTAVGKHSVPQLRSIPGAKYFDLKGSFSDKNSPFPNTLPSEEQFESECQKLGINPSSKIVVFDNLGIYSSPRVWWMFKIMGHDNISVLNGGLPEWLSAGYLVENIRVEAYQLGNFKANLSKRFVKSYYDILDNVKTKSFFLIDARSEGRFNGREKEPRKHLKSGHIFNSINIPYQSVLKQGKFKPELELREIFAAKGLDKKDLVFSCGSGLTACILLLASEVAYGKSNYIYDGSWSEWAERQNLKEDMP
jgi:thiosulfate/3-mercaptopyruvate sulfurtransferase